MLEIDCEHPTIEAPRVVRKFLVECSRFCTPNFYQVHQTIMSPTTNLDQDLDRLKDCPRISSIGYHMYPGKK